MIKFQIESKLEKKIRITEDYWKILIEIKHPSIADYEEEIKNTLINPDEIRRSRRDRDIYLYYQLINKFHLCVIAKHLDGEGFIITAYWTEKIKEGEIIWTK
ncbi:MAG: DUF4258 domain-containing protein [Candidatus Omnitrophica bacterium]|nr:DUF4258 domain-containing protein [Candidatus Omnitrophota bacterium]